MSRILNKDTAKSVAVVTFGIKPELEGSELLFSYQRGEYYLLKFAESERRMYYAGRQPPLRAQDSVPMRKGFFFTLNFKDYITIYGGLIREVK